MSSEFHPLSPQSDYTISSSDRMDDVSLSSRHTTNTTTSNHGPLGSSSSGASVSSKFSRVSRKSMKNSDLGVPLTSSLEERDENGSNDGGAGGQWVGASPTNNNNNATTKSYISEDDPFYMFRSDLVQKLSHVNTQLNKYISTVQTTDTAVNTHEIKEIKKQLKRHIKHAESTLSDLETTVRVVEKSRNKFPHITNGEINERRTFVNESKDKIVEAKLHMQSNEIKNKFVLDERALVERRKLAKGSSGSGGGGNKVAPVITKNGGYTKANSTGSDIEQQGGNNSINDHDDPERTETLLMMQQQDETLTDLDMAVTRVSYMAETIHEEIDLQNTMLKNLDEDLSDAEEQLGVVMGKLGKLLKTKSKCQLGLIVILSLIVLVLFFLVLYT